MRSKLLIIFCAVSMLINLGNCQVVSQFLTRQMLSWFQGSLTRSLCTLKTNELIEYFGYLPEVHEVKTDDGYVLTVFRCNSNKQSSKKKKKVLIIQHGFESSSDEFVIGQTDQALAYVMADAGYDVWLTNNRGNFYSRKHLFKNPDRSKLLGGDFWNFSWDDIALHDYPAVWNYVRSKTNNSTLYIIGHSQGTTATMALLSMRPEYNDYVNAVAFLAPVSYLANAGLPWQVFAKFLPAFEAFENTELMPRTLINNMVATFCENDYLDFCNRIINFFTGPSKNQRNDTLLPADLCHFPSGSSMNQFIHYMKMATNDYFGPRMTGQEVPSDFPLSKITAPIIMYYSPGDTFTSPKDVEKLLTKLTNVKDLEVHTVNHTEFNHIDFTWGIYTADKIYSQILKYFAKH